MVLERKDAFNSSDYSSYLCSSRGFVYFLRHNALQAETKPSITITLFTYDTNPKKPQLVSPLGDLSNFIKTTEDTRNLIIANDLAGAKTHIADFEKE